jgi:hypothetical protein
MRYIAVLVGTVLFTSPLHAEAPCDFKGIPVGNKVSPPQLMSALGVTQYKMNPARPSFDEMLALAQKYGIIPAGELEDWNIGPYCGETSCRVPYGVGVGNNNGIPVNVFIAFHQGLITEIDVSFSETYWDEMLPILDQKYGADWKVDRDNMPITNYQTKKTTVREIISLNHITNGVNRHTNDRCQISATNIDLVFEHHDAYGPYHSQLVIKLISKNF